MSCRRRRFVGTSIQGKVLRESFVRLLLLSAAPFQVDSCSNRRSREDVERLNPQPPRHDPRNDIANTSPWALAPSRFANKSVEEAYKEILTNKDRWIVREEERVVFETTQPISMGNGNHGTHRDAVQDFSIFIPSTNFPPALDIIGFPNSLRMDREVG